MINVTLTGDYKYNEYWIKNTSDTTFNAATADFHVAAKENVPAINIYDSKNIVIDGGEIWGEVSQTGNWTDIYWHMATGFRISNSPNTTIRNVHIDGTWDGIRFIPDASLLVANGNSNGWLVEDVRFSNIRDDAIENDFAATGTLRNSLMDGVFSAFGTVNAQSAHGVLTLDHDIIIMKDYLKDGEMTHGSPFKFNTTDPGNNPDLHIVNTIIAVHDPVHNGISRLKEAWSHLTESSGNYYLNLSDTPFPSSYPLPPKGFTILQGQAARDFLQTEKAQWLTEHSGAQTPAPAPTSGINIIDGTTGNDTLKGTAGVDKISGGTGADLLYGKGGSDQLIGGTGHDKFVFDTAFGSIDQVLDFNPAEDVFYLDNAIFTKLGSGSLSSPHQIGSTNLEDGAGALANDSNDFLTYDKTTGHLSYDADGNGSGAPIDFAHLQPGLDLSAANFWVI